MPRFRASSCLLLAIAGLRAGAAQPSAAADAGPKVAALEAQIAAAPHDLNLRRKILIATEIHIDGSEAAVETRTRHSFWVVENHPESGLAGEPVVFFHYSMEPDAYRRLKKLWDRQTRRFKDNPAVLGNAAAYMLMRDSPDRAQGRELMGRAKALDPSNPRWPERLASHYLDEALHGPQTPRRAVQGMASLAYEEYARYLRLEKNAETRFNNLPRIADAAWLGAWKPETESLAREMLASATNYTSSWAYGNAVHAGHFYLGVLAFARGDLDEAGRELLLSGETKGSPNLDSYGPRLELARALLSKGKIAVVVDYLTACGRFWKSGRSDLDRWKREIADHGTSKLLEAP